MQMAISHLECSPPLKGPALYKSPLTG
jgi:hypothetical protein